MQTLCFNVLICILEKKELPALLICVTAQTWHRNSIRLIASCSRGSCLKSKKKPLQHLKLVLRLPSVNLQILYLANFK